MNVGSSLFITWAGRGVTLAKKCDLLHFLVGSNLVLIGFNWTLRPPSVLNFEFQSETLERTVTMGLIGNGLRVETLGLKLAKW